MLIKNYCKMKYSFDTDIAKYLSLTKKHTQRSRLVRNFHFKIYRNIYVKIYISYFVLL